MSLDDLDFLTEAEKKLIPVLLPVFKREYENWREHEDEMHESVENYLALIQDRDMTDCVIEFIEEHPTTTVREMTAWLVERIPHYVPSDDDSDDLCAPDEEE